MRHFTFFNHASTGFSSYGRLMKACLLFMALVLFNFTQLNAQVNSANEGDYTPHPSLYSLDALQSALSGARDLDVESDMNPDLASNLGCSDLNVIVVLDESGSMNGAAEEEARAGALALAQSFENSYAQLRVVEFASQAQFVNLDEPLVNADYIANFEDYLYSSYNGQNYASMPGGTPPCAPGYTNWEDALNLIYSLPEIDRPNLILFLTDGNPTAYNGGPDFDECGYTMALSPNGIESEIIAESLAGAITQANLLKAGGTHMFPIGVGNGINVANLQLISGEDNFADNGNFFTDDYSVGGIEEIELNLTAGINSICGTVLTFTKSVDIDQVCSEDQIVTFSLSVENSGRANVADADQVDAANVVISDIFPAAYTNLQIVGAPVAGASIDGQELTYEVGSLVFGESADIQVQATLSGSYAVYNNIAAASANNADEVSAEASVELTDVTSITIDTISCGAIEYNGVTYDATGVYPIEGFNAQDCPSLDYLNLTISEPYTTVLEPVYSCGPFTWDVDGQTYNVSGTLTYVIPGENGTCDETLSLELTIAENSVITIVAVNCGPGFYTDEFGTYYMSGIYDRIETTDGECDVTNTLYLTLGATIGGECNDGNPLTENDTVTEDCDCEGTPIELEEDCLGVPGGTASLDDCGVCREANDPDYNTTCLDCAGVVNGDSYMDDCGVCDNDASNDNTTCLDCAGVVNGDSYMDDCGVCDNDASNDNTTCLDCAGVVNGDSYMDDCGVCDSDASNDNTTCLDCAGVVNGTAYLDDCDECVGGTTGEMPCGQSGTDCDNFKMYYIAQSTPGVADGTVFEAIATGGNIQLFELFQTGINGHMAMNTDNGDIYVISGTGNEITTFDTAGNILGSVALSGLNSTYAIAYDPADGKLFVGSANTDKVYKVDPVTGDHFVFAASVPVFGGDIIVDGDQVYLIERRNSGGSRLHNITSGDDVLVATIASSVNGAGQTADGGFIVAEGGGSSSFHTYDMDGSNAQELMAIDEGGNPFILVDGDMASGCNNNNQGGDDCNNFRYFLADSPVGASNSDIYGVEILGGNAVLTYLVTVDYQAHLAFDQTAQRLFMVNRNNGSFEVLDINTLVVSGPVPLSMTLTNVASAGFSPEGDLVIGDETTDDVYVVNVLTGATAQLVGESLAVIDGGDLSYGVDGTLYYASRANGGQLWDVLAGVVVGNMPISVTGAVPMPDGNLMTSSRSFDDLRVYGPTGSANAITTFATVDINGLPITVKPTDLASGCIDGGQPGIEDGGCYASELIEYAPGTQYNGTAIPSNRTDGYQALGEPERTETTGDFVFASLGYSEDGGYITLGFGGMVPNEAGDDLEIVETTWGNPNCGSEYADVFVSMDGVDFYFAKTVCKADGFVDISDAGAFDYIMYVKIVQAAASSSADGYDVDGVVAIHNCEVNPQVTEKVNIIESIGLSTINSYPNPTNGVSQVVFVTAETGRTLVEVYDMNGRNVSTLYNQVAQSGAEYRIDFNASRLPNGVYIYKMTTDKETVIERFMIAK